MSGLDGDAVASASPIASGVVLGGKYRLVRPAGFGGMAELWIAENSATGAEVCVKILVAPLADQEALTRFEREARAAAGLAHRAIVHVYDLLDCTADLPAKPGEEPSRKLAIVMALLEGETLADRLDRGKLSLDEALDVLLPVASGLSYAHKKGIVHRDVKPENIFLSKEPDGAIAPKILDFGVSKREDASSITLDGELLGTPSYMSPEQLRAAKDVDARSDVFSLGLVLYVALAGRNPFEDGHSVVAAVLERDPPRLEDVPDEVWSVLERALAKDRAERFNDATELGIALRKAAGRRIDTDPGGTPLSDFRLAAASLADDAPSRRTPRPLTPGAGTPRGEQPSNVSVPPVHSARTGSIPGLSPARRRSLVLGVVAGAAVVGLLALVRTALSPSPSAPSQVAPSAVAPVASPSHVEAPPNVAPPAPTPAASTPAPQEPPPADVSAADAAAETTPTPSARSGRVESPKKPPPPVPTSTKKKVATDPGF